MVCPCKAERLPRLEINTHESNQLGCLKQQVLESCFAAAFLHAKFPLFLGSRANDLDLPLRGISGALLRETRVLLKSGGPVSLVTSFDPQRHRSKLISRDAGIAKQRWNGGAKVRVVVKTEKIVARIPL